MDKPRVSGIDQVRVLSGTVIFDQVHPYATINLPNPDGGLVEDIFLTIQGSRNPYVTMAGVPFRSPNAAVIQLHMWNSKGDVSIDITSDLIVALRKSIDSMDQNSGRKAYKAAMDAWIDFAEARLSVVYTKEQIASDRKMAASLAHQPSLSSLVDQLGDRSIGTGGCLHIFGYIYESIPLMPISLKEVLNRRKISLSEASYLAIKMQQPVSGVASVSDISGSINYTIGSVIHQPLRDQLEDLGKVIVPSLQDVEEKLLAGGAIMQSLANTQNEMVDLKKALDGFEDKFASSLAEIEIIKTAIANMSSKIDGLR
jgi:hypothetical protein